MAITKCNACGASIACLSEWPILRCNDCLTGPLSVTCPVCSAAPGDVCMMTKQRPMPLPAFHERRKKAARLETPSGERER